MKLGLNVGSGQRPFASTAEVKWVNVDSVAKWNPDILCDGAKLPYYESEIDYFVLHHVLEHFGCGEAAGLIREAHRVLKPGGSLIVCVPDMIGLAHMWKMGKISTQIYMTNVYGAYMGSEEDRHKWGYIYDSLAQFIAESSLFQDVQQFDFRPIPGADIARDWWILGMEARK